MTNLIQKKLIINSDDLGISKELNDAVLESSNNGILTQSSLMANGYEFEDAIYRVIPKCKKLAIGVHLNTYEGKSLTNCPLLTDTKGNFSKSFVQTLLNSHNKEFLQQIEQEWDAQIQKVLSVGIEPTHLDSHVHYHAIPNLFKIAKKLAKKYNIEHIRTQRENFYTTKVNKTYFINIVKNILLNTFTFINIMNKDFKTNDYLIGVLYTSMMSADNVIGGLKVLPKQYLAEILIHPKTNVNSLEYQLLFEDVLKNYLKQNNIILTNYRGDTFDF